MDDSAGAAARSAIDARDWRQAFETLSASDDSGTLDIEQLEHLGLSAAMLGDLETCADAWGRAYHRLLEREPARAARRALELGMRLVTNGDVAQGGAWLGRAAKALEGAPEPCAEQAMLMIPQGLQTLDSGDPAAAHAIFSEALAIGERFRDPDAIALASLGCGDALINLSRIDDGLAMFDQAMIGVTAGEVSPLITGVVYCAVILGCRDAFDVRRAREWTLALDAWTAAQRDLVPFRGQCLVHRSEILQTSGAWGEALEEARRARDRFGDPPGQVAIGMAYYQLAELHRLRGAFDDAEEAYRNANRTGHAPQPGLALLRLAQDDPAGALASIETALEGSHPTGMRCKLLAAAVEIALAAGDPSTARTHAATLESTADHPPPFLGAMCDVARGSVELAEGDARAAVRRLKAALAAWLELDVPYEAARTRVLIARACDALGDQATADLERDAAREEFERLGAAPALRSLDLPSGGNRWGLTPREIEVLRSLATGKTNKAIAHELVISQKTVARHLSNIFTKLGLSTRAEATAFVFKNDLA